MPVPESVVVNVVQQTEVRMRDPQYPRVAIGNFAQSQPELAEFLKTRAPHIGGAQGVFEVAFHGEMISECLRQGYGRQLARVPARNLSSVSNDPSADLTAYEPALANYVASNIESPQVRTEVARIALVLLYSLAPQR